MAFEHLSTTAKISPNHHAPKPPFEIVRLDGLGFDFGSSAIRKESHEILNQLVAYINSKPPVLKLRVEGHTDYLGSEKRNKSRSQSRAEAVVAYLNRNGVNRPMEAVGYGSYKPIAENGNNQGRAKNRRVEVRILRQIPDPKLIENSR